MILTLRSGFFEIFNLQEIPNIVLNSCFTSLIDTKADLRQTLFPLSLRNLMTHKMNDVEGSCSF